jgi:hypothetical protein
MSAESSPSPEGHAEQVNGGSDETVGIPQMTLALAVLGTLIAGAVWFISTLAPDEVRQKDDPGYIDNIFASPIVIAAARIVLLSAAVMLIFAGLYIVASILVRMTRREWLRRAGPFESELAGEVERGLDEADSVVQWWMDALEQNEELERRLQERDVTLRELLEERNALREQLNQRPGS